MDDSDNSAEDSLPSNQIPSSSFDAGIAHFTFVGDLVSVDKRAPRY
jgi:hypothetical protein